MTKSAYWKSALVDSLGKKDNPFLPLQASSISSLCHTCGYCWRERIWSPTLTVMTFLYQVLSATKTCRSAVAMTLANWAAHGDRESVPSADASAYCQSRQHLPLKMLRDLTAQTASHLLQMVNDKPRQWFGRRIWLVDGSTLSMPDTPELQSAYPQTPLQKPGCGFPLMRIVGLFDWASGALVDLQSDTLYGHERHLFRRVWQHLQGGDILVADRGFCGYNDMVQLLERGVDSVVRIHQRRKIDHRKGKKLGPKDHVVQWRRLKQYKETCGISREQWEQLPLALDVREIRAQIDVPGFRSRRIDLATTLLDPQRYSRDEILALYRQRWMVELNLRSVKTDMGMEILRGKSVDVVHKEILMHQIAYNLVRYLMWLAARRHGQDLHRLSFTGTMHRIQTHWHQLSVDSGHRGALLIQHILQWIAQDKVPDRPDRYEPRRRKRRGKNYSYMIKTRTQYKARKRNVDFDAR